MLVFDWLRRNAGAILVALGHIRDHVAHRRLGLRPIPRQALERVYAQPARHRLPMNVAAVTHDLELEGGPLAQFELLLGLKLSGLATPTVISPCDGPLRQEYQNAGVPVEIIAPLNLSSAALFDQSLSELQKVLARCSPVVVYANTLVTFWAVLAAKRMKVPVVWNVRENAPAPQYYDNFSHAIRDKAYECFRDAYRVIFVSAASFNISAQYKSRDNFQVIYDALDRRRMEKKVGSIDRQSARRKLGILESQIAIVAVGSIHEMKGQLDLVKAIGRMPRDAASRVRVFIVGDRHNDYSVRLATAKQALPAELAARVYIIPSNPEAWLYFSAADIAVSCSRRDTYPRVILEAMYFGLPIVTTLTCGCEIVVSNRNALVYLAGDVRKLASLLTRLVRDPGLRGQFGAQSRELLKQRTSFDDMVCRYGGVFKHAASVEESDMEQLTPCRP
jgi:glycosyltransferase involved in cell wall biosynthesis